MQLLRLKKLFWQDNRAKSVKVTLFLLLLCSFLLVFFCWPLWDTPRGILSLGHRFSTPLIALETPAADVSADSILQDKLTPAEVPKPLPAEPNANEVSESPLSVIRAACELIYKGKFDFAGELLKQIDQGNAGGFSGTIRQLLEIIDAYQTLDRQRRSARQSAYQQQLTELEKLQAKMHSSDEPPLAGIHVNDSASKSSANDVNDVNDIIKMLSVITAAGELADDAQKAELLSNSYVKQVFQKAIDRTSGLELQGKYLEAYTTCYFWLQAIDPNNEAYSDYADQLLDKAGIIASLQDSPCETREERFQGIKKEMFIRTIEALDTHYVNTIDYSRMTADAIKRCELLAEIVNTYFQAGRQLPLAMSEGEDSNPTVEGSSPNQSSTVLRGVDANELAAFSAALVRLNELSEAEAASSSTGGHIQGLTLSAGLTKDKFIEIFERIMSLNAVTIQLPRQVLISQFAEAALSSLDPYTVIVWPRQVQDFEKIMTNEFTGIGIEISKPKGLLTVSSLLPDTPAYKAGLDAGDVITAVDGLDAQDMSLICAVHKITGPKGTKVTLTIKRPGEEKTQDITITRARITVSSVRGWQRTGTGDWLYMIDQQNKVGYVRLTSFSADAPVELDKVLSQLEQEGLKGLILDLRFNSGGLLESAVDVADHFIKEGLIVRTQPGFGRTPSYKAAHAKGTHPDYPLVILINSDSASASEIVAGALADQMHNRAVLVGERTHGKGSVQGITEYPGGGAQLKYTMAYYHLPSGQRVKSRDEVEKQGGKDWGVGPNVEIVLTSDDLKKMLDIQRDNDVLVQPVRKTVLVFDPEAQTRREDQNTLTGRKESSNGSQADRGAGREMPKRHTIEETLAADPELAVAVLVIKTKLAQERIQNTEYRIQNINSCLLSPVSCLLLQDARYKTR